LTLRDPSSPLFPYTTLFRSVSQNNAGVAEIDVSLIPNVLGGLGLNSLLGSLGLGNLLGGTTTTAGSLPVVSQLPVGPLVDNLLKDRKSTRLNSSHVAISYAV